MDRKYKRPFTLPPAAHPPSAPAGGHAVPALAAPPVRRSIGKIKPLFTQSHPPVSAHPLPPRPLAPPRGGGPPAYAAHLAQALPGRARRRPPPGGPARREPAGPRPAPQGTARTAAGPPARLGRLGGTDANAMSLLKNAMSLLLKRLIQKRLQPWRRSGGGRLRWVHTMGQRARVRDACTRGRAWSVDQAEDHAKASWRTRAGAIGGGSASRFRCRRSLRITSPCVRAAMIRSAPR